MASILITCDPSDTEEAATAVHDEIAMLGSWWHQITGTWLVDTTASVTTVRDRLQPLVPSGQRLLVIGVTAHWAGLGLPDEAEAWLDAHA